jgi:hypothetical protein
MCIKPVLSMLNILFHEGDFSASFIYTSNGEVSKDVLLVWVIKRQKCTINAYYSTTMHILLAVFNL